MEDYYNETTANLEPNVSESMQEGDDDEAWVTHEFVRLYQVYIYMYAIPAIALPGMFASVLSFIIFMHRRMRNSFNIYLAALCCFDFGVLFSSLLLYPNLVLCTTYESEIGCGLLPYVVITMLPLSLISQTGSICTCIAITVDRFLVVRYPLKSRTWCSTGRAIKIVFFIAIWSMIYRFPNFFEWTLGTDDRNQTVPLQTEFRVNATWMMIRNVLYTTFMFIVPWLIMIVLNMFILRAVKKAYSSRHAMIQAQVLNKSTHCRKSTTAASQADKERHMSMMAVLIIVTFLIFNLLATVNVVMEATFGMMRHPLFRLSIFTGNFLICVNTLINFPIYCTGPKFRKMAVAIFCVLGRDDNQNTKYYSMTGIGIDSSGVRSGRASAKTTGDTPKPKSRNGLLQPSSPTTRTRLHSMDIHLKVPNHIKNKNRIAKSTRDIKRFCHSPSFENQKLPCRSSSISIDQPVNSVSHPSVDRTSLGSNQSSVLIHVTDEGKV